MNTRGQSKTSLRERPFDIYAAVVILTIAIYSFLSPTFPESSNTVFNEVFWTFVDIYMMIAGLVVLWATTFPQCRPVEKYLGQMYGWMFIAAATFAALIYINYHAFISQRYDFDDSYWLILIVWGGIGIAAVIRSLCMWIDLHTAQRRKNG